MIQTTIDDVGKLAAGSSAIQHREKRSCSVCRSTSLDDTIDLPQLPVTGVFLRSPDGGSFPRYDQGLSVCPSCGHAQLRRCLAPSAVYDQTYFHRSSASGLARGGNDAFADFVRSVVKGQRFRCLLEIGANDLYLIDKIRELADVAIGVDPIWKQEKAPVQKDVCVMGKFVEELRAADLPVAPDLVVSVQTFEHVDEPMEQLSQIVEYAADGAMFFLEVPGFDALLRNLRFDQVFHQHIQYFSLASMVRMIEELGCCYVAHVINHRYWGGALGVAFRKGPVETGEVCPVQVVPNPAGVAARYEAFKTHMQELTRQLQSLPVREIYGFGAAQMVPTLAYHMGSDFGFLKAILDDDVRRDGLYYPGLVVRTQRPDQDVSLREAAVLVTAVDSARPIIRRLVDLDPQHVIIPFSVV